KKFEQKYSDPEKDGRVIFTTGSKVTLAGSTAQEMDYCGAFTQLRDAALAIHGVPGVAAGITDGGSYAAFYAALKQLTEMTTQPQLSFIAEEETEQLAPQYGPRLTVEMLAPPINDEQIKEQQLRTDMAGGVRKRDEIRQLRGLAPLGGEEGEELVYAGKLSMRDEVQSAAEQNAPPSAGSSNALPELPFGSKSRLAHLNGHANGNGHSNGHT